MVFDNIVQEVTVFLRKGRLGTLVYTTGGVAIKHFHKQARKEVMRRASP